MHLGQKPSGSQVPPVVLGIHWGRTSCGLAGGGEGLPYSDPFCCDSLTNGQGLGLNGAAGGQDALCRSLSVTTLVTAGAGGFSVVGVLSPAGQNGWQPPRAPSAPRQWRCFACNDKNVCDTSGCPAPCSPGDKVPPGVRNTARCNQQPPGLGSRDGTGGSSLGAPRLSVRYSPAGGRSHEGDLVFLRTRSQRQRGVQSKKATQAAVRATKSKFATCHGATELWGREKSITVLFLPQSRSGKSRCKLLWSRHKSSKLIPIFFF